MSLDLVSPTSGLVFRESSIPDPVFAEGMMGPCLGVEPEGEPCTVSAPVNGTLTKVMPHAFVIKTGDLSVLVHAGIDTIRMPPGTFQLYQSEGSEVEAGTPVLSFSPAEIRAAGYSPMCVLAVLDVEHCDVSFASSGSGSVTSGSNIGRIEH